ncbi:hypothetical protein [Streptomyces sp. NPDC050485]|uniref:hypothetical protein n=1 Tax=Streptomyces sp. NPDC050485 TaxID=3365617 RepID=UPI0037A468C0
MPSHENATDTALMRLPYEKWIPIGAVAQRAKVDNDAAKSVVRVGRRRGVLRTRGNGAAQQVMRVYPDPRRPSRRPTNAQHE